MNSETSNAARLLALCASLLDEVLGASAERFYVYDLNGRCLYVSRQDAQEFGLERTGAIGHTWQELGVPEAVVRQFEATFQQVVREQRPVTGESEFATTLGKRWYRYSYAPIRDAAGTLVAVAAAVQDITREHEADRLRRESEELYRALSEATFESICLHEQGRILEVNEPATRLFGYDRSELVGMSILDLAAPQSREAVRSRALTGYQEPYAAVGVRKDGTTFPGELQGKDVVFKGRPVRVTAIRDLTERMQMEQRWRMVMESSPDLIALIDRDGRVAFLNRTVPGMPVEAIVGKPVYDFVVEAHRDEVREYYRRVFEEGVPQTFESEGLGPDRQTAHYQTRVVPMKVGDEIPCALSISTDITPIRQASMQLARQAVALEQAHELHRIKANFVNAVSHELRTPLTSMFGYLEFLEDRIGGDLTPTQAEYVTQLSASARRLARLVDDLLDFARLEAGTFTLHQHRVDLRIPLEAALKSFRPLALERGIELALGPLSEPLDACVDAQRLQQVLGNLLSNALKFTPEGGRVWIEAAPTDGMARISVHDTGVGIPDAERPRLFQRFSQLEAGLRSGTGSGLGLSIAKALVEAHGGAIGVESTPEAGSVFWFTVPLSAPGQDCPTPH